MRQLALPALRAPYSYSKSGAFPIYGVRINAYGFTQHISAVQRYDAIP
jgi:hypothetical protein